MGDLMAVPEFQSFMLPMLRILADEQPRDISELRRLLSEEFHLSEEDLAERIPSGTSRVTSKTGWAATHLFRAGLVARPARGTYAISDEGRAVLASAPTRVDINFLSRYPSYQAFRNRRGELSDAVPLAVAETIEQLLPEDLIERGHRELTAALREDLLARVKQQSPVFLERLVLQLLPKLGYGGVDEGATNHLGRSGDGGVDGVINEDKLGLERIYLQAKRWDNPVSRPEVQAFVGSLEGQRARKGVFITTSTFTREAREYVNSIEKRVVLVDGDMLASLMLEAGLGVATTKVYPVWRVDSDFFSEE